MKGLTYSYREEGIGMKRLRIAFEDGSEFRGIVGNGREVKTVWNGMRKRGFHYVFGEPTVNVHRMYGIDLDDMIIITAETVLQMEMEGNEVEWN